MLELIKKIENEEIDFLYIYIGVEEIKRNSGLWNITVYIPNENHHYFLILTKSKFKDFIKLLKKRGISFRVEETELYKRTYGNSYSKGVHIFCPICYGDNMFPDPSCYGVGQAFGFACGDCSSKTEKEMEEKGYMWDSFSKCWVKE